MNYLQPYKGKSTRYKCPSCGRNQSFTLYLDGNSHEPIHPAVGRCNREIKCGYHYTPKQYFTENPQKLPSHQGEGLGVRSLSPPLRGGWKGSMGGVGSCVRSFTSELQTVNGVFRHPEHRGCKLPTSLVGSIPFSYLKISISPASNFVSFLQNNFSEDQINSIFEKYLLGATKNKEVIFWQIDITGKIRTGKIMQYNSETGKRIKHQSGAIDWVHNKLKKTKVLPKDFNLQQCFFGEHLLTTHPTATVAIVESEKTACIASCIIPELIWLAAGSLNGLSIEKCQVLKNRNVILFPDLGAYEIWKLKADALTENYKYYVLVSSFLENYVEKKDRLRSSDIADIII